MRKTSLALVLVVFIAFSLAQDRSANHIRNAEIRFDDSTTVAVVEAINRHDLPLADQLIHTELSRNPLSLKWLFLRSMRYYTDIFAHGIKNTEALAKMKQDAERVIEIGEQRLDNDPRDLTALFYAGGAYGYLGLASAADGSVFSSVGKAKKGFNYHEDLIELCPQCYDAIWVRG